MSHFEYLTVAIGIIFSLSLSRLVIAIPSVLNPNKWGLLHLGHFACLLLVQLQFWWRMWTFQAIESWDFLGFSFLVTVVLLYYLAAHILVPSNHDEVKSWSAHFLENNAWFYGAIGLAFFSSGATSYLMDDFAIYPLTIVIPCIFALAAIFNRQWLHYFALACWIMILGVLTVVIQGDFA